MFKKSTTFKTFTTFTTFKNPQRIPRIYDKLVDLQATKRVFATQ